MENSTPASSLQVFSSEHLPENLINPQMSPARDTLYLVGLTAPSMDLLRLLVKLQPRDTMDLVHGHDASPWIWQ